MTDLERAQAMRKLAHVYHDYYLFNIVLLGDDKRPVITGVSASGQPLRFRWEQWQMQRQTQGLFNKYCARRGGRRCTASPRCAGR